MSELKPILNRENSWYLAVEWGLCEVWDTQKLLMQFYETFLSPKDSFKYSTLIKKICFHFQSQNIHPHTVSIPWYNQQKGLQCLWLPFSSVLRFLFTLCAFLYHHYHHDDSIHTECMFAWGYRHIAWCGNFHFIINGK